MAGGLASDGYAGFTSMLSSKVLRALRDREGETCSNVGRFDGPLMCFNEI